MDCKDLLCVLVIYILLEVMKTRFSRENFTRKNNNLNIILQDGDGNIEIMPLKDIYDAIQQAKTASVKHTNHMHTESKKYTNAKHGEAIKANDTIYLYNVDKGKYLNHDAKGHKDPVKDKCTFWNGCGEIFTGVHKGSHEQLIIKR